MDSQQNIVPSFDPTGYPAITGAQLLQLISGCSPYTDKGFVITTTDDQYGTATVPDAATDTDLQRFLWRRLQPASSTAVLYVWNPLQLNPTTNALLYWNPVTLSSIAANTITNGMLAGGITYDKISSIQFSQIIGNANVLLTTSTFAPVTVGAVTTGNVSGAFATGLYFDDNSVTNAMLLSDATSGSAAAPVKRNNIVDQEVTLTKINTAGANSNYVLTSQGSGIAPAWTSPLQKVLQTLFQQDVLPSYLISSAAGLNGTGSNYAGYAALNNQILYTAAPKITYSSGLTPSSNSGVPCGLVKSAVAGYVGY